MRASHVRLAVTDLARSRAFYEQTLGLHVEDSDAGMLYLRGMEERQHHSLVLVKADRALAQAYQSGVLLTGMSAGAICWFEQGFTDSYGDGYSPLRGLGLLAGCCSVHHTSDGPRTAKLLEAVRTKDMPRTLAIDDYSAVLFDNEAPATIYSWNAGGSARYLQAEGNSVSEAALDVETITLSSDST